MLENAIRTISNSNLTAEEKEALLKKLANEIIKKQQNENSLDKELEEKENKNSQASVANDNSEKNKTHQNEAFHDDVSLEEAADNMTTDEMNTILNMFQSQTKDEKILDEIANRLRVNKDSLEEIAKLKEEKLKKNENNSNDDNSSLNEQNNEEDQENQKSYDDQKSNDDSSSLSDNEEKDNTQDGNDNKMDSTPEPAKKVKFISKAKELLKSKVNANTAKALLVIAGSLAALTLLLVNAPAAVAALGAGYIYNEYQKGAKGR